MCNKLLLISQPQYVYLADLIIKSMNRIEIGINALDEIWHRQCLALLHSKDTLVQFRTRTNTKCILYTKNANHTILIYSAPSFSN